MYTRAIRNKTELAKRNCTLVERKREVKKNQQLQNVAGLDLCVKSGARSPGSANKKEAGIQIMRYLVSHFMQTLVSALGSMGR